MRFGLAALTVSPRISLAANEWKHGSSQRIECLGQIQTTGCGLRPAENGDVWVGRNLQHRDTSGQDDQGPVRKNGKDGTLAAG